MLIQLEGSKNDIHVMGFLEVIRELGVESGHSPYWAALDAAALTVKEDRDDHDSVREEALRSETENILVNKTAEGSVEDRAIVLPRMSTTVLTYSRKMILLYVHTCSEG